MNERRNTECENRKKGREEKDKMRKKEAIEEKESKMRERE